MAGFVTLKLTVREREKERERERGCVAVCKNEGNIVFFD